MAMLLGGFSFAFLIIWVFLNQGYFSGGISDFILPISIIAIGATMVESLPFRDIDNLTVPLVSVLIGLVVF